MKQRVLFLSPALLFITLLLFVPFVYLLYLSFMDQDYLYGGPALPSFDNYVEAFSNPVYRESIVNTFRIGITVTVATLVIGFPVAYIISVSGKALATVLTVVTVLPLFVSVVVRGFGWIIVFGREGPLNSLLLWSGLIDEPIQVLYTEAAVVIALTHLLLPFMILPVLASLRDIDKRIIDAAMVLGSRRRDVFLHVIIPLCTPGFVVGSLLVFLHVLATFVLPAMLGSINIKMIATMIYQQVMIAGNVPAGAALAVVLFTFTMLVFGLIGAIRNRLNFDASPLEEGRAR
ncbi:ABC transporter permease [Verticiella sediminum]|uniref:ABC transporter permease n=1 Tax=Verticiella sediminum TaxID=1247510 RepID=A0A556AEA1_9BURK|nr:ABC transporter permease [Verticiella sediminum]TSH91206.1 ABC transporter permease [Verticiella sediminum]